MDPVTLEWILYVKYGFSGLFAAAGQIRPDAPRFCRITKIPRRSENGWVLGRYRWKKRPDPTRRRQEQFIWVGLFALLQAAFAETENDKKRVTV
jgi:hypothetical protein